FTTRRSSDLLQNAISQSYDVQRNPKIGKVYWAIGLQTKKLWSGEFWLLDYLRTEIFFDFIYCHAWRISKIKTRSLLLLIAGRFWQRWTHSALKRDQNSAISGLTKV